MNGNNVLVALSEVCSTPICDLKEVNTPIEMIIIANNFRIFRNEGPTIPGIFTMSVCINLIILNYLKKKRYGEKIIAL